MNSRPPADAGDPRRLISALADGEADAAECGRGFEAWADADAGFEARRSWHAYHLIGDVLRSEDLANPPGHDHVFLERLRMRLAEEPALPVLRAPAPSNQFNARAPRRRSWAMPAALAAGVMALATVLAVTLDRAGSGGSSAPLLAAAPAPAGGVTGVAAAPPVLEASAQGSRIVRDAQLDRYLRAHRDYGAALPGSLPGGPARSIATVSLER
jgi:sigma-E factor negative regulatory protein RseA